MDVPRLSKNAQIFLIRNVTDVRGDLEDLSCASTVAVHVSLVLGVALYTLFGAFTMKYLESPDRIKSISKRSSELVRNEGTRVYLGFEVAEMDPGVHACIRYVMRGILERTKCAQNELEHLNIGSIDSCYQFAKFKFNTEVSEVIELHPATTEAPAPIIEEEIQAEMDKWSFGNAVIFAFTVITTIGYGHIAPETFYGRLFCIFYGVIGVPLTLLTIADMGMFLSGCLRKVLTGIYWIKNRMLQSCKLDKKSRKERVKRKLLEISEKCRPDIIVTDRDLLETAREPTIQEDGSQLDDEEEEEEEQTSGRKTDESIALGITFAAYLFIGAKVLAIYEPEMDFFKALYFNFVTLTTIGLGDFVPKSFDYLFVTLCYIGIGLALTTMAIEIAADLLKKIHYAGRKMENMANAVVWFGGKKMTMKSLVKNLGDQFNIPVEDMASFNLEDFVDNAMKVEAGEIKTLRKPPDVRFRENRAVSYTNLRKSSESDIKFVDDRLSKATGLEQAAQKEDSFRTVDTLPMLNETSSIDEKFSNVPRLDLDYPFFTDSSLPTSFDEDYLRTMSTMSRRK